MPETFDPVTLQNDSGQKLNASYFNRLENSLEVIDDRLDAAERGVATPVVMTPVSGTVTPNALLGRLFHYTATADVALAAPTGGVNGQRVSVRIVASGASRTLSFVDGIESVALLTGETWLGELLYDALTDEWLLIDGRGSGGGAGTSSGTYSALYPASY